MDLTTRNALGGTRAVASARNRRTTTRIEVQFHTFMSSHRMHCEGSGMVLDLSIAGCRIKAPFAVPPNSMMDLQIHIQDFGWTITVDKAVVQWVKGNTFGLRFVSLRPTEGDRLAWVIARTTNDRRRE